MLHDCHSFLLNCEVQNVCIVLKFHLGQVFQRYRQPLDSRNIVVTDRKDQPLHIRKVMCRYIGSLQPRLRINRYFINDRFRDNVVVAFMLL